MNKTELVAAVAEQADISKKDAEKVLKAFVDVVTEEMKKGEKVQLVGFGTFEFHCVYIGNSTSTNDTWTSDRNAHKQY